MAMQRFPLFVVLIAALLPACSGESTESSFCVLVSAKGREPVAELISLLDTYAATHSLRRGQPSPNGITYAGAEKKYLINVSPMGPRGTEVAFFPRESGTNSSEAASLEQFIFGKVTDRFTAIRCEAVKGYGKGKISGFDGVAI